MAGFLDKKKRLIDYKLTEHGRSQLSTGDIRFKYYTFTDRSIVYSEEKSELDRFLDQGYSRTKPSDSPAVQDNQAVSMSVEQAKVLLPYLTNKKYKNILDYNIEHKFDVDVETENTTYINYLGYKFSNRKIYETFNNCLSNDWSKELPNYVNLHNQNTDVKLYENQGNTYRSKNINYTRKFCAWLSNFNEQL